MQFNPGSQNKATFAIKEERMSLEGGSNVTGPKLKLHGKKSETESEETNAKARKRSQKW